MARSGFLWIIKERLIDPIPAQHDVVQQVLQHFPADVMLANDFFFGALPTLLGPRSNEGASSCSVRRRCI